MALPSHSFPRLATTPRILAKLVANYMLSCFRKVPCQGAAAWLHDGKGTLDEQPHKAP